MRMAPGKGLGQALLGAADLFISIHKTPAWIKFSPLMQALAVTVKPLLFSSRYIGMAYEWSQVIKKDLDNNTIN